VRGTVFAIALALAACPGLASADDRSACVAAADKGQTLRDQGKLVEARASFVTCAREVCPQVVANLCTGWLTEATRDLPTVTFRVTGPSGADLVGAEVSVDHAASRVPIDGRAMPVDPGVHHLSFFHPGDIDVEQDVVVRAGEKDRVVAVQMGKNVAVAPTAGHETPASSLPPADGKPASSFRFPLLAGVSLGVGAVAFVTMGILVAATASDVDNLRSTCAGSCNASDVSSANARIAGANVAMFTGIAAVAVAGADLLVVNLWKTNKPSEPAVGLHVSPGRLALGGSF
jgi:hypothetical protein